MSDLVTTINLEMRRPPATPPPLPPRPGVSIVHAERIPLHFYRYLYDTVGEPWSWIDRRQMDQAALAAILADPGVAVHVLHVDGVPAGYVELDARVADEVEIAYFGIAPSFIGQRLGPYLLAHGLDLAWRTSPTRVWLHTCSLDHPAALATYLRAGFVEFSRTTSPR